jgi:hypothetical protein
LSVVSVATVDEEVGVRVEGMLQKEHYGEDEVRHVDHGVVGGEVGG